MVHVSPQEPHEAVLTQGISEGGAAFVRGRREEEKPSVTG